MRQIITDDAGVVIQIADSNLQQSGAIVIEDDTVWDDVVAHIGRRHWTGSEIVPFEPPIPAATSENVNRERSRRIAVGKVIDGVHVTGSDEDARNLANLGQIAKMMLDDGDTQTVTIYRDAANIDHALTPAEMVNLWRSSVSYVSALYAASWALKALDPIPADFAADDYWPA